jgi:hypothetical protein
MEEHPIAFEKRWIASSALPLEEVCERVQAEFCLPKFSLDCEVDSRWGISVKEDAELNITRWEVGRSERLEELPSGFPDYNYLLIVTVASERLNGQEEHWVLDSSIKSLSRRFANVFGGAVRFLESDWGEQPPRFLIVQPSRDYDTKAIPK